MSLGLTLGRGIGKAGAFAIEGVVRGAAYAGDFATDVVAGAELGYAETHAQLLVSRAAALVERDAKIAARKAEHAALAQATNPLPVVVVAPKRAKA